MQLHTNRAVTDVRIEANKGSYAGKPDSHRYRLTVHGQDAPRQVATEGGPLPQLDSAAALDSATGGWYYDPATGVTQIKTPSLSTGHAFSVEIIH